MDLLKKLPVRLGIFRQGEPARTQRGRGCGVSKLPEEEFSLRRGTEKTAGDGTEHACVYPVYEYGGIKRPNGGDLDPIAFVADPCRVGTVS